MSELNISAVKQWHSHQSFTVPLSADYKCPHCKELSHHYKETSGNVESLGVRTISLRMKCSRCGNTTSLWCVGITTNTEGAEAIHLYPNIVEEASGRRDFSDFENDIVPARVLKTYKDAVKAFNAGIWDGAGTLCGKTLEGAVKSRLPENKKDTQGLAAQLKVLQREADLSSPFSQLTNAIRVGRNVSTHFDEKVDIDEETAEALLDLVEYVLEFFFVYETKANALNDRLKRLSEIEVELGIDVGTEADIEKTSPMPEN